MGEGQTCLGEMQRVEGDGRPIPWEEVGTPGWHPSPTPVKQRPGRDMEEARSQMPRRKLIQNCKYKAASAQGVSQDEERTHDSDITKLTEIANTTKRRRVSTRFLPSCLARVCDTAFLYSGLHTLSSHLSTTLLWRS